MSGVKVSCPGCGGPITFPVGSAIVAVCPYCRSVVARGDRKIEDLGKVAALVETDSVLEAGLKGRYHDVPFELTGRTQLSHPGGGVWDEWYAAFADGRWGWLAEAQGRLYLTFEKAHGHAVLPLYEDLQPGERLNLPDTPVALTVAEKSHARAVSAEGAIPFRLVPGVSSFYADLSGPSGEFATLDYGSTPPQVFVGREVTLDDLGIPPKAQPRLREGRQVAGVHLNCPHCGGALELRAPDKSERVVCPSCAALLDANQGQLRYLQTLKPGKVQPRIPLGSTGTLKGQSYMALGFLQRSVRFEGIRYFWEEYLLYDGRLGFRWLVCSDNHWNFVEPLPPGKVYAAGRGATYGGNYFTAFQKATATVENVQGEFYWKVSVGEEVQASDFIRPPQMLSREVSEAGGENEGEINWSLGTYLPVAEVEKAFGLKSLPRPAFFNVAPNQPFTHKNIYLCWGLLVAAACVMLAFFAIIRPEHRVFDKTFQVQPSNDPEKPPVIFTEPFKLEGRQNVRVTVRADQLDNAWLGIDGDLIHKESDLVQPFDVEVSHYHGVEDGETWSEGSLENSVYLSALPEGNYEMRLEFVSERQTSPPPPAPLVPVTPVPTEQPPITVHVRVEQGSVHLWPWVLTVMALSAIPVLVGLYHFFFERRRWEESAFSPFHTRPVPVKSQRQQVTLESE
jgi:hypothetical protein